MSSALRVQGVTKQYGDFLAVDDLSFEVPPGCIYGVLGPNGAGKTTTLRMINDILVPDKGEICLFGSLAPGRQAAGRIGYLPEERGLYPKMKVLEVLEFFGELRGVARKEARRRASIWMERLGISDWTKNRVQDLSKGMQQKVQFITAVLHEPELLILDEPWSGLDPINASVLREVVLAQHEEGRTVLFSTHLMEQAETICDRVCIIARGKVVLEGELEAIKREATRGRLALVELADAQSSERARETVLADQALVSSVAADKGVFKVELAAGVESDALLAVLVGASLPIRRFEVFKPSLQQIFVDRVGTQATTTAEGRRAP